MDYITLHCRGYALFPLCSGRHCSEIDQVPVSQPRAHEAHDVAATALVKRVFQVLEFTQVGYLAPGGLFPGGLPREGEVGVIEEEKTHDNYREKGEH